MSVLRAASALFLLAALVSACGEDGEPDPRPSRADHADWAQVDLGIDLDPTNDDLSLYGADDGVLALHKAADGTVRAVRVGGTGDVESGPPLDAGLSHTSQAGIAHFGGAYWTLGTVGSGTNDLGSVEGFEARAFHSTDGLVWYPVEISGIDGPVSIHEVAAFGDVLVAAGARMSQPDFYTAAFDSAIWYSSDGQRWHEVTTPELTGGTVYDVVSAEGRLVAVGGDLGGGVSAVWESDDGRSWRRADAGQATALTDAVAVGGVVLARGDETGLWRSPKPGQWEEAMTPAGWPLTEPRYLGSAGNAFLGWFESFEAGVDLSACYAAGDSCANWTGAGLYSSPDGVTWTQVDDADVSPAEPFLLGRSTTLADGGVAILESRARVALWSGGSLPTVDVDRSGQVPLSGPEVGTRFASRATLSCDAQWLNLVDDGDPYFTVRPGAGEYWSRSDADTGTSDAWPLDEEGDTAFGYATLTSEDTLEYSGQDGSLLATFERADGAPPPCD